LGGVVCNTAGKYCLDQAHYCQNEQWVTPFLKKKKISTFYKKQKRIDDDIE